MNTNQLIAETRLARWAKILTQREESGLSVKAFCQQAGFHQNVYFYWQRKCRAATPHPSSLSDSTSVGFAEVRLTQPPVLPVEESAAPICINIGPYTITTDSSCPLTILTTLARKLARPC